MNRNFTTSLLHERNFNSKLQVVVLKLTQLVKIKLPNSGEYLLTQRFNLKLSSNLLY